MGDYKTVPAHKCINCGKYYYARASEEEIAGHPEPMERKEIGKRVGNVSRERVRQIENRAMGKLLQEAKRLGLSFNDFNI